MSEVVVESSVSPESSQERPEIREVFNGIVQRHGMSVRLTQEILLMLRNYGHPEVPLTYKALMGTPSAAIRPAIQNTPGGSYYHIGLQRIINELFYLELLQDGLFLDLRTFIDGISLFNASNIKCTPILGKFLQVPSIKFFLPLNVHSLNDFLILSIKPLLTMILLFRL